jgi:hypothetical protein
MSNHDLLFIACNYFHDFQYPDIRTDCPLYLQEQIYEAQTVLAKRINLSGYARTAKYKFHETRGLVFQKKGEHGDACIEFDASLRIALNEAKDGGAQFTAPEWALFRLYSARAERAYEDGDYEVAKETIIKGHDILNSLTDVQREGTKQYCVTRLSAKRHELNGDQSLSNHQLDTAKQSYGRAIAEYQDIGREDALLYLIQRRGLISASLAEQRGNFINAKPLMRNSHATLNPEVSENSMNHGQISVQLNTLSLSMTWSKQEIS